MKKLFTIFMVFFVALSFSSAYAQYITQDGYYQTYMNHAMVIPPSHYPVTCTQYEVDLVTSPLNGTYSEGVYAPAPYFTGEDSLELRVRCEGETDYVQLWIRIRVLPIPDDFFDRGCLIADNLEWGIRKSKREAEYADVYSQPLVGDLDGDGNNEIVYFSDYGSLVVLNDQLERIASVSVYAGFTFQNATGIAIADVDRDGIAEIFVYTLNMMTSNNTIYCYNYSGSALTVKWSVPVTTFGLLSSLSSVADINADGVAELFLFNKIYNAQTGALLLELPEIIGYNAEYGSSEVSRLVTALLADIDQDGILEVVGGNKIYKVSIVNPAGSAGNSYTEWIRMDQVKDGVLSVADIDRDGYLEVVVPSDSLYIWRPYAGAGSSPELIFTGVLSDEYGYHSWRTKPLIADLDGDHYSEIVFATSDFIRSYKYNSYANAVELFWQQPPVDESGVAHLSAFDFNGDGKNEIVYKGEEWLHIMDGSTGESLAKDTVLSRTGHEIPIIVDLERNGKTEIIVTEDFPWLNPLTGIYISRTWIVAYENAGNFEWSPARKVWNQFNYNVANIEDDLTVPVTMAHQTQPVVQEPGSAATYPYNTTFQQLAYPLERLELLSLHPDFDLYGVEVIASDCRSVTLKLFLRNTGQIATPGSYRITFYKDNYRGDVMKVHEVNAALAGGESVELVITVLYSELEAFYPIGRIAFAVNDAGSGVAQQGGEFSECDTLNNIRNLDYAVVAFSDTVFLKREYCDSYVWDGSRYTESGIYTKKYVTSSGCDSTVVLDLTLYDLDVIIRELVDDFCELRKTMLLADVSRSDYTHLKWNTGDTIIMIEVDESGRYWVDVKLGPCSARDGINIERCEDNLELYVPNTFSASNQDGLNDYFEIKWPDNILPEDFEIYVYNRWGEQIFHSKDPLFKWDGTYKNTLFANQAYNYLILYSFQGKEKKLHGTITVL